MARIAIVGIVLLLAVRFVVSWDFGGGENLAEATVRRMADAPSYGGIGLQTMRRPPEFGLGYYEQKTREEFAYGAPDKVKTTFITMANDDRRIMCRRKEIIVVQHDRYQRCLDADAGPERQAWQHDSYDPSVFSSVLFQPWQRFSWCGTVQEGGPTTLDGEPVGVFSCTVPNEREAETIWEKPETLDKKDARQRQRFLDEALVEITVWVRARDGYIARFRMEKQSPATGFVVGENNELVDYRYCCFGEVEDIAPPGLLAN